MNEKDLTRNERQKRWYYNHQEEKLRINRERYHNIVDNNLCINCGQSPVVEGKVRCKTCRDKANICNMKRRLRIKINKSK